MNVSDHMHDTMPFYGSSTEVNLLIDVLAMQDCSAGCLGQNPAKQLLHYWPPFENGHQAYEALEGVCVCVICICQCKPSQPQHSHGGHPPSYAWRPRGEGSNYVVGLWKALMHVQSGLVSGAIYSDISSSSLDGFPWLASLVNMCVTLVPRISWL